MAKDRQGSTGTPKKAAAPAKKATAAQSGGNRTAARQAAANRRAAQAALAARRRRNQTVAIASVVIVIVIVIVLVVAKASGNGGSGSGVSSPAAGTPIPVAQTSKLQSVPLGTLNSAPTSGLVASPQAIKDPPLTSGGKPELLFIGAEFCPICATERWPMYVALSKFGTFTPAPGRIHSAVRDGNIQTITFYGTNYTSPYFTFTPVETTTNQPDGDYYVTLQTPTAAQQRLWVAHTNQDFPWLDFGGKMELTTAQFDPTDLEGVSFNSIVRVIGNNSTAIGANVDASAKVLIQTICKTLTGAKPANVCSAVGNG